MKKIVAIIFVLATAPFGLLFLTGNGGIVSDVQTAVVGHVEDAISRTTDDQLIEYKFEVSVGVINEDAEGQDAIHWATGTILVVQTLDGKTYIQLQPDFNSGPLPDGHVYISLLDKDINSEADFNFDTQIDLGKLKKGSGASWYEVPDNLPASLIKSVTIWCKAFGEYIGSANVE